MEIEEWIEKNCINKNKLSRRIGISVFTLFRLRHSPELVSPKTLKKIKDFCDSINEEKVTLEIPEKKPQNTEK